MQADFKFRYEYDSIRDFTVRSKISLSFIFVASLLCLSHISYMRYSSNKKINLKFLIYYLVLIMYNEYI